MKRTERVASRLDDAAAVQMENGSETVACMLRDEANAIRSGGVAVLPHFIVDPKVYGVATLREQARARQQHAAYVAITDTIIDDAWLCEGVGVDKT